MPPQRDELQLLLSGLFGLDGEGADSGASLNSGMEGEGEGLFGEGAGWMPGMANVSTFLQKPDAPRKPTPGMPPSTATGAPANAAPPSQDIYPPDILALLQALFRR